jgi:hypothetical protein
MHCLPPSLTPPHGQAKAEVGTCNPRQDIQQSTLIAAGVHLRCLLRVFQVAVSIPLGGTRGPKPHAMPAFEGQEEGRTSRQQAFRMQPDGQRTSGPDKDKTAQGLLADLASGWYASRFDRITARRSLPVTSFPTLETAETCHG